MNIGTMSVVVGGMACNASCPFCVSKMTGDMEMAAPPVNWHNYITALKLAERTGVTTMLLTGKGEPTLWPTLISEYLRYGSHYLPPLIELQTNGLRFQKEVVYKWEDAIGSLHEEKLPWGELLEVFRQEGLTTVALSVVHYQNERNAEIYTPGKKYPDLATTIKVIKETGLSVRLTVMLMKGYIDNCYQLEHLIRWAKTNGVDQLTIRPITSPDHSVDPTIKSFTDTHTLAPADYDIMTTYLDKVGDHVLTLSHGAKVFDVAGQNVCASNCLTVENQKPDSVRQIIFFPDGSIRYAWQYEGARLL